MLEVVCKKKTKTTKPLWKDKTRIARALRLSSVIHAEYIFMERMKPSFKVVVYMECIKQYRKW